MKKQIPTLFALGALMLSCAPDFDLEGVSSLTFGYGNYDLPPGPPAHFTIHEPHTTLEVTGDARPSGYGYVEGPGTVMYKNIDSYDPVSYFYELKCISSTDSIFLYFDFYTTAHGQPLGSITTGTYYARHAAYSHAGKLYQAFHLTDNALNQQLNAAIFVTEKIDGRITGSFTGSFYKPDTHEIVTITGEFKNVYVYDEVI